LKEENDLVHESCTVLEQQLEQSQRKASTHLDTETKLSDCQDQLQTLKSDLTKV
uniref:Centromere protein F n=1 Tax=Anisakis simplex TaxID=6269 RepID=A0A0M3JG46_ANISI